MKPRVAPEILVGGVHRGTQIDSDDFGTIAECDFGKPAGAATNVQDKALVQCRRQPFGDRVKSIARKPRAVSRIELHLGVAVPLQSKA